MKRTLALSVLGILSLSFAHLVDAQSLGGAGTVGGTIVDPSGAVVPGATVTIINRVTNYRQSSTTDDTGTFRLTNVPPNPYHLETTAPNFASYEQDVDVRGTVPLDLKIKLALAGTASTVTVEAAGADLLENVPYAHNDVDTKTLGQLPINSPGSGLSDAVMLKIGRAHA